MLSDCRLRQLWHLSNRIIASTNGKSLPLLNCGRDEKMKIFFSKLKIYKTVQSAVSLWKLRNHWFRLSKNMKTYQSWSSKRWKNVANWKVKFLKKLSQLKLCLGKVNKSQVIARSFLNEFSFNWINFESFKHCKLKINKLNRKLNRNYHKIQENFLKTVNFENKEKL